MGRMAWISRAVIVFSLFVLFMPLSVSAQGVEAAESIEWGEFESCVPDSVRDAMPNGALDGVEEFAQGVEEMTTGASAARAVINALVGQASGALRLLAMMTAVSVIAAAVGALSERGDGTPTVKALRICTVAASVSAVIYTLYGDLTMLGEYLEQTSALVNGMIPVTAAVWAMGGNVSTAAAGNAGFYVTLAVCENIFALTVMPICCVLTVLGICDALGDEVRTGRIMSAIKKIYFFLLASLMTLLLASMTAQTALAASADTLAARGAKMMSGSMIPVLGGSVGETFRTLAGSVTYLKSVFGIGGIVLLALNTLPFLASVLLTRAALLISSGVADILGCSGQAKLFEHLGEVYGCMLAVVSAVSTVFILYLCVFMQTVVAVA